MIDSEKYPVDASKISNSSNICREDLIGRDVTLTLTAAAPGRGAVSLGVARLPGKAKEEPAHMLHFSETPKTLVLNATNRKTLQRMLGNKTASWIGKKITLYYKSDVRCPDGSRGGTRIREIVSVTDSPPPADAAPAHDTDTGEVRGEHGYGPPPMDSPDSDGHDQ